MAAVKNIHGFTLDVKRPSRVSVALVAGDTGNRFNIVIANGGVPMTGFTRAVAAFTRADGLVYTQDSAAADSGVTVAGSIVNIDVFASSFCAGKNTCELQLYSTGAVTDDTLVTTAVFSFFARAAAVNDASIQSSAQFPALLETAYSIDNMTIDAETLSSGVEATATISEQDGVKHIHLGIPKGTPSVIVSYGLHPTRRTQGVVGQFYLNIASGRVAIYVCTSIENGIFAWQPVYVSETAISSVNGQTGAVVLGASDVGASLSVLVGASAPTTSTIGAVGQLYINTADGQLWVCRYAGTSTYAWIKAGQELETGVCGLNSERLSLKSNEYEDMRVLVYATGESTNVDETIVFGSTDGSSDVYIVGVKTPASQNGAANKGYVDAAISSAASNLVRSVNGQTGAVVLDADAVGALPAQKSGEVYELTGAIAWDGETLATEEGVAWLYEPFANKVTSISADSTDTQYPSAKCVYEAIREAIEGAIEGSY